MWGETGWGMPTSVALHLALAFLLLVRLPELSAPAQEPSINVELVPPPPKGAEKPKEEPKPAKSEQARPQPQAFESAAAEVEKKEPAKPELPPAAPNRAESLRKTPDASQAPTAKTDSPASEPAETRTAVAELRVEAEDAVNGGDDVAPALQPAPVPKERPTPDQAKAEETAKVAEAASEREAGKLVEAAELYSKNALSHPRAKQAIGQLPPKERIKQICNFEALEQVRHARPDAFPDILVPFGPSGGFVSETGVSAKGGAFRSRGQWYAIDFRCEIDAQEMSVVSFRFAIGAAIPKSEWGARQFPRD